jgi:hypothetical protein
MVLLGDEAQVDAWFTSFGDGANLDASRSTICYECPQAQKSFSMHPMVLLGDEAQVEAWFSLFRDSANLDER